MVSVSILCDGHLETREQYKMICSRILCLTMHGMLFIACVEYAEHEYDNLELSDARHVNELVVNSISIERDVIYFFIWVWSRQLHQI